MSIEENKAIGRRFFEAQDENKGPLAEELCAPGYTAHLPGGPPMDFEGHSGFGAMFYGAFPNLHHTIESTIAEEDRVAVRFTLTGTHEGDFMGVPATGRSVAVPAIAVLKIEGGEVPELHGAFDRLGMMGQLGVIPTPDGAEAPPMPSPAPERAAGGSSRENEAALRRAIEHWNSGDLPGYLELYGEGVTLRGYAGVEPGFEGVRRFYEGFMGAFPGSRIFPEDVFSEGDELACRFTLRGTHGGILNGIPPTGKEVSVPGITILRFEGGRCVERWSQADFMGMMQQIGAIPTPEAAEA